MPQFDKHYVRLVVQGEQIDGVIANGNEASVGNEHDSVPTWYFPKYPAIGHEVNGRVPIWP